METLVFILSLIAISVVLYIAYSMHSLVHTVMAIKSAFCLTPGPSPFTSCNNPSCRIPIDVPVCTRSET